jgi:hypothetical protein|nr:MAG TPA: Protein of unknown function (DUF3277) [Caudoviricetes sp.]
MSSKIKTYNPKEVTIAAGSHIVTGFADDTFISIEANGDGITKKVGCDGEIVRAVSPDNTFKVNITLLQTSDSNAFFSEMCDKDLDTGDGMFPLLIKDLKGGLVFSTEAAWCMKKAAVTRGKETNNREWELDTGDAVFNE